MGIKRTVLEEFTDDLDGGKAEGTVQFSYDGVNYEIDLSKKNKNAMEKAFRPYLGAARKVKAARNTRAKASSSASARRGDLAAVRAWAKENGFEVSDRGRVPASVLEAFDSAS